MHRTPLLQSLARYAGRHPEASEQAVVARFIDFVRSQPDCFSRELLPGHVTGSAWLVNASGTAALLTHHRKLGRWLQPGGHADGDPDVLAVALREAGEESGLGRIVPVSAEIHDVDIHVIPARGSMPEHEHFDVRYALRHEGDGAFAVSEESIDLAWVPIGELSRYTAEESVLRLARKWAAHAPKGD